jgi:two-component system chemotaxis response regulator CheY
MARILVCDDSAFLRKQIRDILAGAGHEIVGEAANGKDAYDKFAVLAPDIVTMDMMMEPDGHEASKRIIRQYPKAKIIIITSLLDDNGEVSETVRLGGKGFVAKPVDKSKLLAEVEKVLAG